jgi:glycosyltransferase involved in cell wall biosynthesis
MNIVENVQETSTDETEEQRKEPHSPLKILAVFFHPSTRVTAVGGAEKRFIETLKIFCNQNNIKITVLESSPSLLDTSKIRCEKHSVSSGFQKKGWLGTYLEWGFWIIKAFFKSVSILKLEKPDVILVTNNTLPNLALGTIIGLISRRPTCTVVHHIDTASARTGENGSLYCGYRNINYARIISLVKALAVYITLSLVKRTDAIIAVSDFTSKILRRNGVSKSRISVSGNAVDFDFISKIGPCESEVFDGIFVGRISKEKGIFDLVEVWKKVVEKRDNARLLIIGNGVELTPLKKEIAEAKLERNILIQGRCSDIELYSLLKSSKVFIFPSLFEGWGIAVAEALACGLSVVAYDIPALREIFGFCKNVFLVPVGEVDKITQKVLEVLSTENESEISMSYAKKFEWKKVAAADAESIANFISGVYKQD